jgi:hypothetical protein
MKTVSEFQQFYMDSLLPELEKFEKQRKKILARAAVFSIAGLVFSLILGLVIASFDEPVTAITVAAVAGFSAITGPVAFFSQSYKSDFKNTIIEQIVYFIDPAFTYDEFGTVSPFEFDDSRIFNTHADRLTGGNRVAGKLGETPVSFSEVHAEYYTQHTDKNGNTHEDWHTIFKGLFFAADFNKSFSDVTVVLPDYTERVLGSWLSGFFQKINPERSEQLVKLENPEFEKEFVVYGNDQIEARYIITPVLMERLLELRRKANKRIYVSFANSYIYIAIASSGNMFEPRLFRTVMDFPSIRQYFEIIQFFANVVELLQLNTRVWTKK